MRAKPMHRFLLLTLLPVIAQAHEGHGMEGASHYHATDVWGFVTFVFAAVSYTHLTLPTTPYV